MTYDSLHALRGALLLAAVCALAGCPETAPPDPPPADGTWAVAFDATDRGWLLDVWGSAGDDLYAVGGTPEEGSIHHFNGATWQLLELGVDVPLLNWVHGFGAEDITFVGNAGTAVHFDGASFTVQDTPTDQALWGVWGASPDDLWAAGGDGRSDSVATLLHFDGSSWEQVALPTLQKANVHAFFKVWGVDADNVWVVGQRGVVLRYDGSSWTEELVGASDDLVSIWGTDASHVFAVGGRNNGIVSAWDGTQWRTQSLAPLQGLNGVFTRTPEVVHVVGQTGTIARLDGGSLEVLDQSMQDTPLDLHAVFGDDDGRLTAVGGSLATLDPPHVGIALTRELEGDE